MSRNKSSPKSLEHEWSVTVSRSVFIEFREAGFWAFDVVASVFLKYLIDAAHERFRQDSVDWLESAIAKWRVNAVLSDHCFHLDGNWSESQIDTVTKLCRSATAAIRADGDIPAVEIGAKPILEDHRISTRGIDPVPCEPIARFGEAVIALLQMKLPEAPDRHWWFFTFEEDVETLAMRTEE